MDKDIFCINFNYKSPHEDMENSTGLNTDGSVNVKYTLTSMRDLLQHNIDLVNKLLEKSESVTNINIIGYGLVKVDIEGESIIKNLVDTNVIYKLVDQPENNDQVNLDELEFSDEETNNDRYNMINNLVNTNDVRSFFDNDSDSETNESEDEDLIDDEKNTQTIINKYTSLIPEGYIDAHTEDSNDD
jgi:hypothetical protein